MEAAAHTASLRVITSLLIVPFSQKDLENLKAEVQRRQQLQESEKNELLEKSEQPSGDGPLELVDKIPVD